MATLDEQMPAKIEAARRRLEDNPDAGPPDGPGENYSPEELRVVFKKFRRLMGTNGNPGTIAIEGALRAGWVIASGTVEGYGDEVFHVIMLTNGALHYSSGELTGEALELTDKWFLGDSIPELEARIPDTLAHLAAREGIEWEDNPVPKYYGTGR